MYQMKNNKKLGKKFLALSAIASMGVTFATISPELASAAQLDTIPNTSPTNEFIGETKAIQDWQTPLTEAELVYGKHLDSQREYRTSIGNANFNMRDIEFHSNAVSPDGPPNFTDVGDVFVGHATLNNDLDEKIDLKTDSFSRTLTDSVTTSTTHGFKIGEKTSGKISFPIGEMSQELSLEYNFSTTDSQTNTDSRTYTIPSQTIPVKPHSSVEVIVMLKRSKATGNVNLLTKMSGRVVSWNHCYYPLPGEKYGPAYVHSGSLASMVKYAKNFEKISNLSVNLDDTINLIGKGTYEAEFGTEYSVTVRPIDKKGKYTGEDYTYTVKPEVTKAEA
ncbi:sulfurtransferase (plasmid) [Bacillus thuringiensis]|nr:sulfurtransferase [Bacillus thuringiensis]